MATKVQKHFKNNYKDYNKIELVNIIIDYLGRINERQRKLERWEEDNERWKSWWFRMRTLPWVINQMKSLNDWDENKRRFIDFWDNAFIENKVL